MNTSDSHVAVQAEALYLVNLLLAPGLGFIGLLWLARRHANDKSELTRCHLRQTIVASLWAGALLMAVTLLIVLLGGFHNPATWIVLILYFVCCHSVLILFGVLGLAHAMSRQLYIYPLIGSRRW
ncbi:cytochrome c oxidase subunit III [Herminiimonas sp. CN]|uniref:cytochrome c oxidase subunit III n=1 Tax=Herminiimonas sp. CN TaxID=1349818 RepID=UPI00047325B5|nr:cytochrome c oxidase subunit III [Herminiimonas sp. CN]